jgi:hypothetical protein
VAAAVEEEANVEVAAEETGSSNINDNGGDRKSRERKSREQRELREFWNESETMGQATIYWFKNISNSS